MIFLDFGAIWYNNDMKIVFPEMDNLIIREAIRRCPEITAVAANSLDEACQMVENGSVDGMVVGIDFTSREIILKCREHITMTEKYFSSSFVMRRGEEELILADGGVCKNPNEEMLTNIVLQTYETAEKILTDTPRVAMLSFSTFGSGGDDPSITKIQKVIERVVAERPEILIDGEMQLDAAIVPEVAERKAAGSSVAGRANVLICPDLNSGNILYKAMERLGGWTAAGPILQGFKAPISDLSRGSTVEDVVLVVKIMEKLIHE